MPPRRSKPKRWPIAVAIVVALLVAGVPASQYTSGTIDRGSSFSVSGDANAVLGISGLDDAPATFTNNGDGKMEVTVDTSKAGVDFKTGSEFQDPPVTFTLSSTGSQSLDAEGASQIPLDIVVVRRAGGDRVGQISLQRDLGASQASGVEEVSGSATSSGNSGTFGFDLTNSGSVDAEIVAIGINETTNPNAAEVSSGNILTADGTQVVSQVIPVDSSSADATRVDFDQNVTVNQSQTKPFRFNKFRKGPGGGNGSPNADMRGQDVRVTLYFSDGSAVTLDLCNDGCDF